MHYADIEQMEFIHPIMRLLLEDIDLRFGEQTITSLFRIDDDGVHGTLPLRGVDLRSREVAEGLKMAGWINLYWKYDPTRPKYKVAKAHGNGSNFHIHCQVSDLTEVAK